MNYRIALCVVVGWLGDASTMAQGTAFTYQGRLSAGAAPANGTYDFTFQMFDAASGGTSFGGTLSTNGVPVANGVFTATLDFGSNIFTGPARWLQISVTTNLAGNFTTLSSRQLLTPAPYAVFAGASATVANGAIGSAQLSTAAVGSREIQAGSVTAPHIASNQVVKSLNALTENVTLTAGPNITINTVGNSLRLSAPNTGGWGLAGTAGTSPTNGQFLGTTDNQPFELKVNSARALRLEPTTETANVIGGSSANRASPGVRGATIAGGGRTDNASTHSVQASYGTIGGGLGNTVAGDISTIAGGNRNIIRSNAFSSVVGGGTANIIEAGAFASTIAGGSSLVIRSNAFGSTIAGGGTSAIGQESELSAIGGGYHNTIGESARYSTIGGGATNSIGDTSPNSTISGGLENTVEALTSGGTISGGWKNRNEGDFAAIGGGQENTIHTFASWSTIGGGRGNTNGANATYTTIAGGRNNTATGDFAAIGGGRLNKAGGDYSSNGGGYANTNSADYSTIGGGAENIASGDGATIGGGGGNIASGVTATIGGGSGNSASGRDAVIGGGFGNTASAGYVTVGGGFGNTASAGYVTVGGGVGNIASATTATIGGGSGNSASGSGATVPGGESNSAEGELSFAAGHRAKALHRGAFVWADSTDRDFASLNPNMFQVRASGGVRFYSTASGVFGAQLEAGTTTWSAVSDRSVKKNVAPVDSRSILEKLTEVPIQKWNYQWEPNDAVPHLGPMAQDFKQAFYPGREDKTISTLEFDGVALAAIQGLNQKLTEELKRRDAENAKLQSRLAALEELVLQLSAKEEGSASP